MQLFIVGGIIHSYGYYFHMSVIELIIAGGIKALWNFTPFRIRVPEDIVVQNTSMYAHLAVMFNRLNSINH